MLKRRRTTARLHRPNRSSLSLSLSFSLSAPTNKRIIVLLSLSYSDEKGTKRGRRGGGGKKRRRWTWRCRPIRPLSRRRRNSSSLSLSLSPPQGFSQIYSFFPFSSGPSSRVGYFQFHPKFSHPLAHFPDPLPSFPLSPPPSLFSFSGDPFGVSAKF